MARRFRVAVVVAATAAAALTRAPAADAQQRQILREPAGFDFTTDGVWRPRARAVRAERMRALSRGETSRANAPVALRAAAPAQLAVTGTLQVPVFLVRYTNSPDSTLLNPRALYDQLLFGVTPPLGRPYTYRSFYEEMSNGLFSIRGQVFGWLTLANPDTVYEGNNNGLNSSGNVPGLILEAMGQTDATVNFAQYDNDGPDGVPNTGDDDGFVDLAVLVHPEVGGECGSNANIWAHRFSLQGWGVSPYVTNDARPGGGVVRINDYIIQSGLGGANSCTATDVMPIGTLAHETGHGLGLPDLYDTSPNDGDNSEGIGEWGLMGSGNYARPLSPAHMEAWSKVQLGWVMVRPLTAGGGYSFGPTLLGDTVFLVRPNVPNTRGEYFLLENRQAVGSDTALIDRKGGTGGLLIWHVDSLKATQGGNSLNSGSVHLLWLIQADGLNQLRSSVSGVRNRGDGGDPYPGTAGNTAFGIGSTPEATLNVTGNPYAGIAVDSIRQLQPNGAMAFSLTFIPGLAVVDTALSGGIMGAAYADTLRVSGGTGTYAFTMLTGQLPPGLALGNSGIITGIPTKDSAYTATVRVTSGSWIANLPIRLAVTAPTLALQQVVDQVLQGGTSLTPDQQRYLDLLGNNNLRVDVGDVLAWLDRTGSAVDAGVLRRLMGRVAR